MRNKANQDWREFILQNGYKAKVYHLAHLLGLKEDQVLAVRASGACRKLPNGKSYDELFTLWHGRAPEEADWPPPKKTGGQGYEWLPHEISLLAGLVGAMGVVDIARFLTKRLQKITGDRNAERSYSSIIGRMQKIGLQTADVLGGITTTQAAKEINSRATINHVISNKQLRAFRIGRLWVIPHDVWAEWKAGRVFPPKGYVQLSTLKKPLSIKSDKLSEWARAGLVPSAVRCNPYGTKVRSTQFGTWFIDKKVADKLVADRRAGKPMPWHTKSDPGNLRVTFKLWQERKHPASCSTCKEIWGKKGAPNSFDEYMLRYPPLAHGAKRHLTRQWSPGLTINEVAAASGCSVPTVAYAIKTGTLRAHKEGACLYISRTDATRWKARRCPTGDGTKSWISIDTACQLYLFTQSELKEFVDSGQLNSKIGAEGGQRGIIYVLRQQCRELREKIGFTEEEAAARVGVSVPRFRRLLDGVDWRNAEKIPLVTVQAVIKRLKSRAGYTIEEAAIKTGMPEQWVQERIKDGTIRIAKAPWDLRRTYISEPMINRLLSAKNNPEEKNYGDDWLLLSDAAEEAGVSTSQIIMWSDNGELKRRKSIIGWRYHRNAVRARARVYWGKCRFVRAEPPSWLKLEMVAAAV